MSCFLRDEYFMEIIKSEKGKLTIVEGKTAAGKTMSLLIDAENFVHFNMDVLFFTLEQPAYKLYNKFFDKVKAEKEHGECMHIVDSAFSFEAIEAVINNVNDKINIVYIDSIQNIIVDENVTNKYHYITSRLIELASKKNIAIVISSQVSLENDSISNQNTNAVIEEIKSFFKTKEEYEKSIKHLVLRDFSGFESYDYFSSKISLINNDNSVIEYSSFNLSDYFNN